MEGVTDWLGRGAAPLPVWAMVLLGVVGLLAAALNFLRHNVMTWRMRLALAAIRLGGVALLLLMLCQLELRLRLERNLRPTVAVLTDTSASMGLNDADGKARPDAAREVASGPFQALAWH